MPNRSNRTLRRMFFVICVISTLVVSNVLYTMVTAKHFRSGVDVLKFKEPDVSNKVTLTGNRGTIYDRGGEVIAEDEETYNMILILSETRKDIGEKPAYVNNFDRTAHLLSQHVPMSEEEIRRRLIEGKDSGVYQIQLGDAGNNLSNEEKKKIEDLQLPGIVFEKTTKRTYPTGNFSPHLVGFAQYDESAQRIIGQMGLEQSLDNVLKGEDGTEVYTKDANGNIIPGTKSVTKYPKSGNSVYLTLDRNVQLALQSSLAKTLKESKGRRAWGIVMEVETGKILGWAGLPAFDLNERKISSTKGSYLNIPSSYLYEPGSVMKGITYAAAIDSGHYPYGESYESGVFYFGEDKDGKIYRSATKVGGLPPIYDALGKNFGTLTFDQGFVVSSNIAICELLTNHMDPSIYRDYAINRFKFTQPVDIPYVPNANGNMRFTQAIEKLNTGFGQGLSVTALQMVQAYSAILNDGKMVRPYVVDRIVDSDNGNVVTQYKPKQVGQPISKKTANYVTDLMRKVIEDEMGTGHYRYQMDDISLVAKTGTGQIATENGYGEIYTNSIIAGAPADDPKILMYYIFESKDFMSFTGEPMKETMKAALVAENIAGEERHTDADGNEYKTWEEYSMPSVINHQISYADRKFKDMNVEKIVIGNGNSIIAQYPKPNDKIVTNQRIFLLTDGAKIDMPDMAQWTKKDITAYWNLTNIEVVMNGSGSVVSQNIAPGEAISKDTVIKVKMK